MILQSFVISVTELIDYGLVTELICYGDESEYVRMGDSRLIVWLPRVELV